MVNVEQRRENMLCRLCVETIDSPETSAAGINLLENADVKKLLQDVYELQILPDDSGPTMVCMPCYQQLIKNYTLRMKLLMLRKTYRINQTVMVVQISAFNGPASKPDENNTTSEQENSTQTEQTASTSRTTMGKEQEDVSEASGVTKPSSMPSLFKTTTTKVTTAQNQKQLVPMVLDCLKVPLYLKALWPLVLSTDRDDPASLVFLCSTCHKSFKAEEKFDQHQSNGCVACCRYCVSEMTEGHSCPFLTKYSSVMPHIVGSSKYVTANTIPDTADDVGAGSDASHVELGELCDEPKGKKSQQSELITSVERRSVTPNLRKTIRSSSITKNSKTSKNQSQPDPTLPTISSTISSEDKLLVPATNRKSSVVASGTNGTRKRKRSTK